MWGESNPCGFSIAFWSRKASWRAANPFGAFKIAVLKSAPRKISKKSGRFFSLHAQFVVQFFKPLSWCCTLHPVLFLCLRSNFEVVDRSLYCRRTSTAHSNGREIRRVRNLDHILPPLNLHLKKFGLQRLVYCDEIGLLALARDANLQ